MLLVLARRTLPGDPSETIRTPIPSESSDRSVREDPAAPATGSIETSTSGLDRSTIPQVALLGRVLDDSGKPVAGAELSWTALLPEFVDPSSRTEQGAFEEVARSTMTALTDEDGSFSIPGAPPGALEHPSVVWICHETHLVEPVLFERGAESWSWPPDLRLARADAWSVLTVDFEGAAVEGAEVAQHLILQPLSGEPAFDRSQQARRVFRRKRPSDAQGKVVCCAVPGASFLLASKGSLRAPFAYLPDPPKATVRLVLRECFQAVGRIDWGIEAVDPQGANISFAALVRDSEPLWLIPRVGVRGDGTFGPVDVPVIADSMLQARLDGGPFLQCFDQRAMPWAGARVAFVLEAATGKPLEIHVIDEARTPIVQAHVEIVTEARGTQLIPAREAFTDAKGVAELLCPDRLGFHVQVGRQGYAFETTPSLVWSSETRRLDVVLRKGGVVRGRCLHEGRPVPSFEVNYWTKDVYASLGSRFDDEEGEFELEGLPLGEVHLFASAPDLPQSPTHATTIGPEPGAPLEIELGTGITLRSRVISAVDRAPVANAFVQPYSSRAGQILFPNGDPVPVGADGTFELRMVGSQGIGYGVSAEGFAPAFSVVVPGGKEKLKLGTIALVPYGRLVAQVVGEASGTYEGYLVSVEVGLTSPATGFDERGFAVLGEVHPSGHELRLRTPSGDELVRSTLCRAGPAGTILFDVSGTTRLVVELASIAKREPVEGGRVVLVTGSSSRSELRRQRRISGSDAVVFERSRAGIATIEVRDARGRLVTTVPVEIGSGPEQRVRVDDAGGMARFRIVDRDREPLSSVSAEACSVPGEPRWSGRTSSDRDGLIAFGPTSARRLALSLSHGLAGKAWGIEVEFDVEDEEPQEVVLDGRGTIDLLLVDGDGPREGVVTAISSPANSIWQWITLTSGPDGRVTSTGFASGEYEVFVGQPGIWPARSVVRPSDDGKPTTIQLRSTGDLELILVDEFGRAIADVGVDVRSIADDGSAAEWFSENLISITPDSSRSGVDGKVLFVGLPEGSYTWRAEQSSALEGTCAVDPRARTTVDIRMP